MGSTVFENTLKAARYRTGRNSAHPFYLVQLSEEKERDLHGVLVSDALAWLLEKKEYSNATVILQTHGWNTPVDKAIKVPFSEFISGMQDDSSMPSGDNFKPIFIAFTWDALPLKFILEKDALTHDELIKETSGERVVEDKHLSSLMTSLNQAARGEEGAESVRQNLKNLADTSRGGLDEKEEEDVDAIVDRALVKVSKSDKNDSESGLGGFVTRLVDPIQRLLFGRLINRGTKTGVVMRGVIAKLMRARRGTYCLMANSLGAHVIGGALKERGDLPFRMHTVFFVQGACNREWFGTEGRYKDIVKQCAGPVVCTLSDKDTMLSRVFEPFHGDAIGTFGFLSGTKMKMRPRNELKSRPYEWSCGDWNSVDGSEFIDEGGFIDGGHGDFKEDETTMTYWSAIKVSLPDEKYDFSASEEQEKEEPENLVQKIIGAGAERLMGN